VTRADRYAPGIDRVFLEYAQFRGFIVDPAIVRHATGKPKVERGIPYCRGITRNVYGVPTMMSCSAEKVAALEQIIRSHRQ
jgi:hypothetical protein